MLQIKVPFLAAEALDDAVSGFLREYAQWKGSVPRPPIDVDEVVEGFLDLDFALADLRKLLGVSDVLGATWFEERKVRVDQSLEGKEGRLSFTLGHEVGHWVLHRPIWESLRSNRSLFEGDTGPAIICRSSQRKVPAESQADQFSVRLLMPESDVRAVVHQIQSGRPAAWPGLRKRLDANEVDERLRELAEGVILEGLRRRVLGQRRPRPFSCRSTTIRTSSSTAVSPRTSTRIRSSSTSGLPRPRCRNVRSPTWVRAATGWDRRCERPL